MRTKVRRENKSVYFHERTNLFRVILGCVFSWVLFVYLLVSFAILMNDINLHRTEVADTNLCLFPLNATEHPTPLGDFPDFDASVH